MMCDTPEHSERGPAAKACAVCSGKFGLIRYYSLRAPAVLQKMSRSLQGQRREREPPDCCFRFSGGMRISPSIGSIRQF